MKNVAGPHVLIIGAGITGLLIAQGLKKAGVSYTIFDTEAQDATRRREWTLAIHWSIPILENLLPESLRNRLFEAQTDPSLVTDANSITKLHNSQTGEVLRILPTPFLRRMSRKKLRTLFLNGIDVAWEKNLQDITYDSDGVDVTAHFADGSSYHGDVLIGADGPRSKVREILLGVEKGQTTPLDVIYNMSIVRYNDAEKALFLQAGNTPNHFGYNPNGIFSIVTIQDKPDLDKPETWVFQVGTSWKGHRDPNSSNEERIERVKEVASQLIEPFRSANLWMPGDTVISNDAISYWISIPFDTHQGRITLCGDAAHPLPPHRGQGLNHAILDASNLVAALVTMKTEAAKKKGVIVEYTEEMVKRGAEEVRNSVQTALAVLDWAVLMESPLMKDGIVKLS